MKKPVLKSYGATTALDVHDVMNYIDSKFGSDCYDVFGSQKHFDTWCDAQGYGAKDPYGKKRSQSQAFFADYMRHPDGNMKRPPFYTVLDRLDEVYDIYAHKVMSFTFSKADFASEDTPEYMKEFADHVVKVFGDQCLMGHDFDDR